MFGHTLMRIVVSVPKGDSAKPPPVSQKAEASMAFWDFPRSEANTISFVDQETPTQEMMGSACTM